MTRKQVNLADSSRARLLNRVRERKEDYQVTLGARQGHGAIAASAALVGRPEKSSHCRNRKS